MFRPPRSVREGNGGFYVDVGESSLFYIQLDDVEAYDELYRSEYSVLIRALLKNGEKLVVRTSWSKYKRVAQNRGYTGMIVCEDLDFVPEVYSRDLHIVGSTYVEVSVREYIEGHALSEVWTSMSQLSRARVTEQMEDVVCNISKYRSSMFMKLQGKNLSTSSPVQFVNYRMILSMITADLNKGDMKILDMQDFCATPVLSHNNLSMDHVIVAGDTITGIVGWRNCDYYPEVMARMQYQFRRPVLDGESEWYNMLSKMDLFYPPPPPLYTACCMYYNYYLRLRSTPEIYHECLQRKLSEMSDILVPSVRETYMGVNISSPPDWSDHGSQYKHAVDEETNCFQETHDNTLNGLMSPTISSISSWANSEDNETVLDILDSLSVV